MYLSKNPDDLLGVSAEPVVAVLEAARRAFDPDQLLVATVNIKGDSYRLREKKKAGLLGRKTKPAGDLEEVGAEA